MRGLNYSPPGPVVAAFLADRESFIKGIMGPIGSGKTAACLMEIFLRAQEQAQSPVDGIRYTKFMVVRDTLRNLNRTTLPSWRSWTNPGPGEITGGSGGEPANHKFRKKARDGSILDVWVQFVGLGDHDVESVLRGWEGTAIYLNEADQLAPEVISFATGRVGRYPGAGHGYATNPGVWVDFNAPDDDNWTYQMFVNKLSADGEPIEGVTFYVQPSGFSPKAENKQNLRPTYYEDAAKGQPKWYIRRMIENKFGHSRDGLPVFMDEFDHDLHVAVDKLEPAKDFPIFIGLDQGLRPAAVFAQRLRNGQWRFLHEEVPGVIGAEAFGELIARALRERFPNLRIWSPAYVDPAGTGGVDKHTGEKDWRERVAEAAGLTIEKACTDNSLTPRLDVWRQVMTRGIGSERGLMICPSCRVLRRALNSMYRFKKQIVAGRAKYSDKPMKDEFADVVDAGGYLMIGGGEYQEVMKRKAQMTKARVIQAGPEAVHNLRW